jgi:hypothetical protein
MNIEAFVTTGVISVVVADLESFDLSTQFHDVSVSVKMLYGLSMIDSIVFCWNGDALMYQYAQLIVPAWCRRQQVTNFDDYGYLVFPQSEIRILQFF